MTAAISKNRKNEYVYYWCLEHRRLNLKGAELHDKMENLLDILSFSAEQLAYIHKECHTLLKEATKEAGKIAASRLGQVKEVDAKLDNLEERLIESVIDSATYKKWRDKLLQQKALLENDLNKIRRNDLDFKWNKLQAILPKMTSLKDIYLMSTPVVWQKLLRTVFEGNLTYLEGRFRTPKVHPGLRPNILIAKQKGLLETEKPLTDFSEISRCTECTDYFEHLERFCMILEPIIQDLRSKGFI